MEPLHTLGPYTHTDDGEVIKGADDWIAIIHKNNQRLANAAFIVRALNGHGAMLEALKHAVEVYGNLRPKNGATMDTLGAYEQMLSAIRLAEGGE